MSNSNVNNYLTRNEAAAYLKIASKTLANWASTGKVEIPYHKLGKLVRYSIEDLNTYLDSVKMRHTSSKF